MTNWTFKHAAKVLLDRADRCTAGHPVTDEWKDLDADMAYRVQDEMLRLRVARGETLIGVKLGLTSGAKQRTMGISSPLTAWLTDAMVLEAGGVVALERLIHPRAEPEIAFILGRDLSGPGVTAPAVLRAVDQVFGAIEVIDSRFTDFKFTLPDVIADNGSASGLITGSLTQSPLALDLALEPCALEIDGRVVDAATGAAVQGHPAQALAAAANALGRRGHVMREGWLVFTGGMTDAVPLHKSSVVSAVFNSFGRIDIRA
jgi:2-oxo-3-hexenedioate decarboxylase